MNALSEESSKRDEPITSGQPIDVSETPINASAEQDPLHSMTGELDLEIKLERAKGRLKMWQIIAALGILDMVILGSGAVTQMKEAEAAEAVAVKTTAQSAEAFKRASIEQVKRIAAMKESSRHLQDRLDTTKELGDETIKRVTVEMHLKHTKRKLALTEDALNKTHNRAVQAMRATITELKMTGKLMDCLSVDDATTGKCVKRKFHDAFGKKKRKKKNVRRTQER